MVHGDSKGLVLPPRVAPIQAVIVPIFYKDKDNDALKKKGHEILQSLTAKGFRVHFDDRDTHNPGFKYNYWELKGVPVRLDLGPKDLQNSTICIVRRDTGTKEFGVGYDKLAEKLEQVLGDIHNNMFTRAKKLRDDNLAKVTKWDAFVPALDNKNIVLAPWCEDGKCEDDIKANSGSRKVEEKKEVTDGEEFIPVSAGAKSLCVPFEQPELEKEAKCVYCGKAAKVWCLFGRSY